MLEALAVLVALVVFGLALGVALSKTVLEMPAFTDNQSNGFSLNAFYEVSFVCFGSWNLPSGWKLSTFAWTWTPRN